MDEYISREEAVKKIKSCIMAANDAWESGYNTAMAEIMEWIKHMPTADVQPIKHGRWIPQGDDMWLCSNCKENIIYSMSKSDRTEKQRYCCRCGARMDAIYQDDNITAIKVTGWENDEKDGDEE